MIFILLLLTLGASDVTENGAGPDTTNAQLRAYVEALRPLGLGRTENAEQIDRILEEACEFDPVRGCYLGLVHRSHIATSPIERQEIVEQLRQMCNEHDYARACATYASTLRSYFGDDEETRARALSVDEVLCGNGMFVSCAVIGSHYARGLVYQRDFGQAQHYYGLACDNGAGSGCFGLADLRRVFSTNPSVLTHTSELYERGCELGEPRACLRRADDFQNGTGVELNLFEAQRLRQRACQLGELEYCTTE